MSLAIRLLVCVMKERRFGVFNVPESGAFQSQKH